jgi:hypothetical protein
MPVIYVRADICGDSFIEASTVLAFFYGTKKWERGRARPHRQSGESRIAPKQNF